jgi:hypothetical protein
LRARHAGRAAARHGAIGVLADGEAFDADPAGAFVVADDLVVRGLERELARKTAARDFGFHEREEEAQAQAMFAKRRLAGAGGGGEGAMLEGVAVATRRAALRLHVGGRCAGGVVFLGKSPGG